MNPKSLDKNKTNKAEWKERFETLVKTYEKDADFILDACLYGEIIDFISSERQRLIDQVEKEVIGEDEVNPSRPGAISNEGDTRRFYKNQLRAEFRQKLSAIRLEVKEKK